MNEVQ